MSWAIQATGSRKAVRQAVERTSVGEQKQGLKAKAFILSELDTLPSFGADYNGVRVEAFGHSDVQEDGDHSGAMQIKIETFQLAEEE